MNRAARRAADRDVLRRGTKYRPDRLTRARHEAGHALACIAFEVPFRSATVDVDRRDWASQGRDPRATCTRTRGEVTDIRQVDPWLNAVIRFAGPLAEGTYLTAGADLSRIAALDPSWIEDRSPGSPWVAANDLVTTYGAELDRAAAALAEAGTLLTPAMLELLRPAFGRGRALARRAGRPIPVGGPVR